MGRQGIRLGVAYYPEQWPRQRWRTDAAMMAEAGLSVARIGEFAWSLLEPEPGRFELDWLAEAVGILAEAGLDVILGTPTAAPPAWLVDTHPEILPVDGNGRRQDFGHRRHYCPNQPAFQARTRRVVGELGRRFGRDRRVIGWQIDNEFGGRCYCKTCHRRFQVWLRDRYESLQQLNASWGTAFWSQTYSRWEQIPLPQPAPQDPSPSLALDYRRFMSDSYVAYQALQARILRGHMQGQFVTHNLMGFGFPEIDYNRLARDLDVVGWDNYPTLNTAGGWFSAALAADAMRGLKRRPFWVLEQQAGPVGWGLMESPAPGQIRLWTYQAIAHGAEAVLFFRWRTARFGTEQHWHGILDADGGARRRYRDLRRLSSELKALAPRLNSATTTGGVALLHDYDSRFALQVQATNPELTYEVTVLRHYEALRKLGLGVDVLADRSGLDGYPMVVAPSLYLASPDRAGELQQYVAAGGTLVLAPRTAVKDSDNALPERPLPAWLDELCGLTVTDYQSVPPAQGARIAGDGACRIEGEFRGWYEELDLAGARALASYLDGPFAGSAAITEHRLGRGRVLYLAGAATQETLDSTYEYVAEELKLNVMRPPREVEVVTLKSAGNGELLFLLNHSDRKQEFRLGEGRWHDHVSGLGPGEVCELDPHGVALLESARLPLVDVR